MIIAAIATGYLDHHRAIPGIAVGTLVAFLVASGALVLLYASRKRESPATRAALEVITGSAAAQFFVVVVLLVMGQVVWMAWWEKEAPGSSTWFSRAFFSGRLVAYYVAMVLTYTTFKKKDLAAERFLLVPVMMAVACFDFVVSVHAPAPFWIGSLVAIPLISFGVAAAAGFAVLFSRLLVRTETIADGNLDATNEWLARCVLVATVVGLVTLGGAIVVFATVDVASIWQFHARGVWRVWLGVAGGLFLLGCVAAKGGRGGPAGVLVFLGLSILVFVAIVPATAHSENLGIGGYALGGFAGAIAAPAFGIIAALNKLAESKSKR